MYKPNFCVECGERIVRARWYPWTSRRFCKFCGGPAIRKRLPGFLLVSGVLIVVGIAAGRSMRVPPPPLIIQSQTAETLSANWTPKPRKPDSKENTNSASPAPGASSKGATSDSVTESNDVVYLCGAKTKKGTMCTRRVHGAVRCWQHKGMTAMLPPEKLIVHDENNGKGK